MVQTIPATKIDLYSLKENFRLERNDHPNFFLEWQENLPELSQIEQQELDEIKLDYLHISQRAMLEPIVKMAVLSPLLRRAGFYRSPFYLAAEKEVKITSEDRGFVITGKLDLLIYIPQFWILVIESKRAEYSVKVGIPQILAYMLDAPATQQLCLGLVTNGSEFRFVKLVKAEVNQYALSRLFSLDSDQDLGSVLRVLKSLAQRVTANYTVNYSDQINP